MSENISMTDITDALEKISAASTNQPGNQEEIFKLLKQIPTLSKSILPIVYNAQPVSSSHGDVLKLFQYISKHLVNELKHLVQGTITTIDRPKHICICIENLTLLAGDDFGKEKLTEVVSHATYLIIQENMEFVENLVENLPRVADSLVLLIENVKPFALDMCEALFLCEVLNMTCVEQKNWVSNVILEKLSTELLTIIDALKEFAIKSTSVGKATNFLQVDSNPIEDSISTVNLLSLGLVLNAFNDLEISLHGGIASKVQKMKNSSDKFKKSSLKHRLPDILRSSQEANWMRSLTIFGQWDWQEIIRDIAPAVANSMTEAFENFHTKEMSSLKNSQGDEAYQVDIVPSLSSELLPGPNTPKKTICQFKEIVSLMKSTLPYAVIGSRYKLLSTLLSCYIDECSQSLKMMKSYLSMLLNDFPEKVTASAIFCTIAACEDVIATLQYCSANINTDVRAPFQGICQSYCDMNKTLKSAVIQYLCSRIRLNILHDGESNHFSDPKEFADGERCSYAVENWRRFLDRIREQMDSTLSSFSKNKIFSMIFIDSLNVLKMRYLRCEPSYNRAKQLGFDIPYIISTCEKYYSVTSPDKTLFDDSDRNKVYSICQLLHAVMTIINVPLTLLRKCLSNTTTDQKNARLTDLKSEAAQFLEYQELNQDSLVHCLVALLSNEKSFLRFIVQSDDFAKELGTANSQKFHHCLYQILASSVSLWCDEFFNCALMSVNNDHGLLLQNCMINSSNYNFSWQSVFFHKLDDILCKSLVSPVSFLTHPCWSHFMKNVISSFPPTIKTTVSDMASKQDDTESRLMVSVILILLGVQNALYILPEWLTKFFTKLKPISSNQSENNETAIKVILNETSRILSNPDIWEEHCQLNLTKDGVDAMHRASLVVLRICSNNFKPNTVAEEVVTHFLNSLCKEANECFRVLPEVEFHYSDEELAQECKLELAHIETSDENAWDSFKTIHVLLTDKADWLKSYWLKSQCENSALKSLQSLQSEDGKCHAALSRISWRTVKIIFLHRWEAKTGAALTDKQAEDLDMILQILERNEEAC